MSSHADKLYLLFFMELFYVWRKQKLKFAFVDRKLLTKCLLYYQPYRQWPFINFVAVFAAVQMVTEISIFQLHLQNRNENTFHFKSCKRSKSLFHLDWTSAKHLIIILTKNSIQKVLEYGKLEILESLSYVVMRKFEGGSEKFVFLNKR